MDITQLILDDHHEQRRLFAILEQIDRSDTGTLSAVWARLGAFLEMHAAAEEAIFYPALLQVGIAGRRGPGWKTRRGRHRRPQRDPGRGRGGRGHPVGSDGWYAAVAGRNLANGDHMARRNARA